MTDPDARVAQLAETQSGYFTRRQAIACGMTDVMLQRRVRAGRWHRVESGIYRLVGAAGQVDAALYSACLKLPGAVASHESAARLLDFPHVPVGQAAVTVPLRTTHRCAGVRVHESTDIEAADCIDHGPIALTWPVRTVIDLSTTIRPQRLSRIVGELLAAGTVTLDELATRHSELARRGKPGTVALRELLDAKGLGYVAPESELEAQVVALLARSGLPAPVKQMRLPWRSGAGERVDLAYPDAKLIIECDGRRWHSRERDFERDRQRDNQAMLAGWRVLRITYRQVRHEPGLVVAMVRQALESAAA